MKGLVSMRNVINPQAPATGIEPSTAQITPAPQIHRRSLNPAETWLVWHTVQLLRWLIDRLAVLAWRLLSIPPGTELDFLEARIGREFRQVTDAYVQVGAGEQVPR